MEEQICTEHLPRAICIVVSFKLLNTLGRYKEQSALFAHLLRSSLLTKLWCVEMCGKVGLFPSYRAWMNQPYHAPLPVIGYQAGMWLSSDQSKEIPAGSLWAGFSSCWKSKAV